eukprot:TRINITY_DN4902_c0_g1_i8.p1 TRINITY_DN4902_c0_g1~~TRINITY_DN4902_c0_g1_i8.p1  ORF type:complete len:322 (+),score=66.78 TRINITY_DN4902_c0_g1_i8:1099-2064(+)
MADDDDDFETDDEGEDQTPVWELPPPPSKTLATESQKGQTITKPDNPHLAFQAPPTSSATGAPSRHVSAAHAVSSVVAPSIPAVSSAVVSSKAAVLACASPSSGSAIVSSNKPVSINGSPTAAPAAPVVSTVGPAVPPTPSAAAPSSAVALPQVSLSTPVVSTVASTAKAASAPSSAVTSFVPVGLVSTAPSDHVGASSAGEKTSLAATELHWFVEAKSSKRVADGADVKQPPQRTLQDISTVLANLNKSRTPPKQMSIHDQASAVRQKLKDLISFCNSSKDAPLDEDSARLIVRLNDLDKVSRVFYGLIDQLSGSSICCR